MFLNNYDDLKLRFEMITSIWIDGRGCFQQSYAIGIQWVLFSQVLKYYKNKGNLTTYYGRWCKFCIMKFESLSKNDSPRLFKYSKKKKKNGLGIKHLTS